MNNDSVCKQDSFLGILAVAILTFLPPWTLESFNGVTGGTLRRAESNVELSMQVNRVQLGMGNIKKNKKLWKGKSVYGQFNDLNSWQIKVFTIK